MVGGGGGDPSGKGWVASPSRSASGAPLNSPSPFSFKWRCFREVVKDGRKARGKDLHEQSL